MDVYLPILKKHLITLALGFIGVICLVYGLIASPGQKEASKDISFQTSATTRPTLTVSMKKITIDIEGAVVNPGVYELASDSRLQEAIRIAGGMRPEADHIQVAQNLNLASKLIDGGKIYIPFLGESAVSTTANVLGSQTTLVNINTATSSQLEDLPGIGQVTAKKIIDNRPIVRFLNLHKRRFWAQKFLNKLKI